MYFIECKTFVFSSGHFYFFLSNRIPIILNVIYICNSVCTFGGLPSYDSHTAGIILLYKIVQWRR
jgi:hypothetical protein